jgi:hypothetical protein
MAILGGFILIIAVASGAMVLSSDDINSNANLFWCFGMCMRLDHQLDNDSDPNNPDEEIKDEVFDAVRDDIMGKRCGSAADPMC